MFGGSTAKPVEDDLWQDREIRFDSPPHTLDLRKGEIEIDQINSVEDTKGNNGEGVLLIEVKEPHRWQFCSCISVQASAAL